jgi:hypothetical protein
MLGTKEGNGARSKLQTETLPKDDGAFCRAGAAASLDLRATPRSRFTSATVTCLAKNVSGSRRHLPLFISTCIAIWIYVAWK